MTEHFPIIEKFPRPDWDAIHNAVEKLPESEWENAWSVYTKEWTNSIIKCLSGSYRIYTTKNFYLISSESERYATILIEYFEKSLKRILGALPGIANDEGYGKHLALVFSDDDTYYDYISWFFPDEGRFGTSSGIYLNRGYGHFVFPFMEMYSAEATATHELTHACLSHLPIPLWVNEGLAVSIEERFCGSAPLSMNKERVAEHEKFWNAQTIQQFWSGECFSRPDEGQSLSYELAQYCVRSLARDYDEFVKFVVNANWQDSGETAAWDIYGGGLGGLIEQFFGPGNWDPEPGTW